MEPRNISDTKAGRVHRIKNGRNQICYQEREREQKRKKEVGEVEIMMAGSEEV